MFVLYLRLYSLKRVKLVQPFFLGTLIENCSFLQIIKLQLVSNSAFFPGTIFYRLMKPRESFKEVS